MRETRTSGLTRGEAAYAPPLLNRSISPRACHASTWVIGFAAGSAIRDAQPGDRMEPGTREAVEFTETVGMFASFLVWVIFGALFVGPVVTQLPAIGAVVYAALSLTIIRLVPVAIALVGTHLRADSTAFIGWFGPRGLASVVFSLIAVEELTGPSLDGQGFFVSVFKHLTGAAVTA